ncbi:fluoride efflux transporter CrcB [Staphylococcus sp. SQ8-PEA]|uniref:Fluoride-specific ion channel FluC n=1 Tax=Staphylococcus marylandisciuri TaxID=2981529 RepID=A0ABT2QS60_9STAP|nr:fluoride efflux transporter CrcB [Staphylococcus marylandisciuri]MCU5746831.1 fluoride efflux transporter CrcB [Staphylococcus marylandisciuri]
MSRYVYIFVGGAIGAMLRYKLSQLNSLEQFPLGTFIVNLTGAFLMGLISVLALHYFAYNSNLKKGLTTGLLGALTTFSTLQFECVQLLQQGDYILLMLYAMSSYLLGIALCFLGAKIGGRFR